MRSPPTPRCGGQCQGGRHVRDGGARSHAQPWYAFLRTVCPKWQGNDQGLVAPVDISLGEGGSTDEMCLEIFGIAVDAPPQPTAMRPEQSMMPMQLLKQLR